ncbi:MAG: PIG-L family deacetylase [Acidobacteriia bacterium]|nr:PIG-L family deacetylase [Terriglobia bacterium]
MSAPSFAKAGAAALAAFVTLRAQVPADPGRVPPLDLAVSSAMRLLVISPHPDDETLGAAGLMRRVIARGGQVHVVWMTSGDGFPEGVETADGITHPRPQDYRDYGKLREREARAAAGALGLDSRSLTFLGFPDEGLCELASAYLSAKTRAFESPYTDRFSPPLTEQVIRGVRYRGVDVRRELERVIAGFAPTVLVDVHPEDEHPDHCSTHVFIQEALQALAAQGRTPPRTLRYLIHYERWPLTPDAGQGSDLRPPAGFPASEGRWVSLALTPDEIGAKKVALLLYRSQMLVIGRFMQAFARSNELYLEGEPASPPECWCQNGVNVATEVPPEKYRRRPRKR